MSERLPPPDTRRFPPLEPDHVRIMHRRRLFGRIHSQGGAHPTRWDEFRRWGPGSSRFDHHPRPPRAHPTRGVLYAAPEMPEPDGPPILRTCVAEVYGDRRILELRRDDPYIVLFELTRPVHLLDLADSDWLTLAGGNAAISSGLRSTGREWARAVYRHYTGPDAMDGLVYTCSNVPSARSVVLWERATDAIPRRPALHLPLSHPSLRAEIEVYAAQLKLDLV